MSTSDGPLAGTTVVSLEQANSAPLCSRTLGDFGARVVKVDCPRAAETGQHDDMVTGVATRSVGEDRGKESVALDPQTDSGMAVLDQLLAKTDVLVSDYDLARLGIDPGDLAARHPDLILVDIGGYDSGGTRSQERADDRRVRAELSEPDMNGRLGTFAGGMPATAGRPLAGVFAGLYAALSIVALLYEREALRGRGARRGGSVAVNLFDTMTELIEHGFPLAQHAEVEESPSGMNFPVAAPCGAYGTADGRTVVLYVADDDEWQRLARDVLARGDLADDERFCTKHGRVQHYEVLDAELRACCAREELAHLQQRADAAGGGHSGLNLPSDVVDESHLPDRQRWRTIDTPGGPVTALLPPVEIAGYEPPMGAVPGFGEHTYSVLAELGIDEEQIARLCEYGIIGQGR